MEPKCLKYIATITDSQLEPKNKYRPKETTKISNIKSVTMNKGHFLLICITIALFTSPIFAQTFSGGSGTQSDPYQISNVNDILSLANNSSSSSGKFYMLTNNIDMQGEPFNQSIGPNASNAFMGHFDGGGHKICNLSISVSGFFGNYAFFGYIKGATIENLELINCNVSASGKNNVGGLCAQATTNSVIRNVSVNGNVVGGSNVGMICGTAITTTIEDCVSSGSVKATSSTSGGICGYAYGGSNIKKCCNLASVEARNTAGGICGTLGNQNPFSNILDCSNFGVIKETQSKMGGIVGVTKNYSKIERCISASNCSGNTMGAIVGTNNATSQFSASNLFYDYQICTNIDTNNTIGNPQRITTKELTNGISFKEFENWSQAPGRYPIPIGLENNSIAQVAAAAAVMSTNDDGSSVQGPVLLSQVNGETWTCTSGSSFVITDGCMAYPEETGNSTIAASITKDGFTYTKSIALKATNNYAPNQVVSGLWNPVGDEDAIVVGNVSLGNPSSPSTFTVHNLHISNSGTLTLFPATTLIVEGIISCSNASSFILEEGAQLVHNNSGVKATLKKSINGYSSDEASDGWYFISAPFTENSSVSSVQPQEGNFDLYRLNETNSLWENVRVSSNNFTSLDHGRGYLYANSTGEDISLTGTLFAYYLEIYLSNEGHGWNLVGNPFPCNAFVDKPYYVCSGSSIILGSGSIPPGTGIIVQPDGENDFVNFTKANIGQQSNQPETNIIVEVYPATRGDIIDNASISFGSNRQIEKYYFNDNSCLYIPQESKEYAMISAENNGTLPLCFVVPQNGEYTIRFNTQNANMEYFHLIDNITGADVDLLNVKDGEIASYTFSAKKSDYLSRFKLVFEEKSENIEEENNFAYFCNDKIIIMNDGKSTLQIFDMMGRIIENNVISGDSQINREAMSSGIYILKLNGKTQKIILD